MLIYVCLFFLSVFFLHEHASTRTQAWAREHASAKCFLLKSMLNALYWNLYSMLSTLIFTEQCHVYWKRERAPRASTIQDVDLRSWGFPTFDSCVLACTVKQSLSEFSFLAFLAFLALFLFFTFSILLFFFSLSLSLSLFAWLFYRGLRPLNWGGSAPQTPPF